VDEHRRRDCGDRHGRRASHHAPAHGRRGRDHRARGARLARDVYEVPREREPTHAHLALVAHIERQVIVLGHWAPRKSTRQQFRRASRWSFSPPGGSGSPAPATAPTPAPRRPGEPPPSWRQPPAPAGDPPPPPPSSASLRAEMIARGLIRPFGALVDCTSRCPARAALQIPLHPDTPARCTGTSAIRCSDP